MFNFLNRVFSGWKGDEEECTCGQSPNQCPYCIRTHDVPDLGLSRPDVNFYFAAISVCSPYIHSFGLPATESRQSSLEGFDHVDQASVTLHQASTSNDAQTATNQTRVDLQNNSDQQKSSMRGRYDYMGLLKDHGGPQERYYCPKSTRVVARFPASDSEQITDTSVVSGSQTSATLTSDKLDIITKLRGVLEEYRMIVTSSKEPYMESAKNQESVVVSVSIKSLLNQSLDIKHSTPSVNNNNAEELQSSSPTDEPSAVFVTIPTPAACFPPPGSPHEGQSGLIRRLLSTSPGLEQELRERAADVWGTAIGFDEVIHHETTINEEILCPNHTEASGSKEFPVEETELSPSEGYRRKRDSLKVQIRELFSEVGLLRKFEKELTVVKKGNSKFHQAQQVVPGLW